MITYSELFQFCLVILAVLSLVFQAKKEITAQATNSAVISNNYLV